MLSGIDDVDWFLDGTSPLLVRLPRSLMPWEAAFASWYFTYSPHFLSYMSFPITLFSFGAFIVFSSRAINNVTVTMNTRILWVEYAFQDFVNDDDFVSRCRSYHYFMGKIWIASRGVAIKRRMRSDVGRALENLGKYYDILSCYLACLSTVSRSKSEKPSSGWLIIIIFSGLNLLNMPKIANIGAASFDEMGIRGLLLASSWLVRHTYGGVSRQTDTQRAQAFENTCRGLVVDGRISMLQTYFFMTPGLWLMADAILHFQALAHFSSREMAGAQRSRLFSSPPNDCSQHFVSMRAFFARSRPSGVISHQNALARRQMPITTASSKYQAFDAPAGHRFAGHLSILRRRWSCLGDYLPDASFSRFYSR